MVKGHGETWRKHENPASEAMPPELELDLNQFLPYRLSFLADRISQALAYYYAEYYQLNIAQWRVLAWLSHRKELTAKEIRRATRMDKARVSRAVQGLVSRNLISSTPSRHDQRCHSLCLTLKGQKMLAQLIPEAHAWEADLVATLTAGEYRDLFNLMGKLERQLDRIEYEPFFETSQPSDEEKAVRDST